MATFPGVDFFVIFNISSSFFTSVFSYTIHICLPLLAFLYFLSFTFFCLHLFFSLLLFFFILHSLIISSFFSDNITSHVSASSVNISGFQPSRNPPQQANFRVLVVFKKNHSRYELLEYWSFYKRQFSNGPFESDKLGGEAMTFENMVENVHGQKSFRIYIFLNHLLFLLSFNHFTDYLPFNIHSCILSFPSCFSSSSCHHLISFNAIADLLYFTNVKVGI